MLRDRGLKFAMTRWTFRILICLILGVVTTVGVAWGLALWSRMNDVELMSFHDRTAERMALDAGFEKSAGVGYYFSKYPAFGHDEFVITGTLGGDLPLLGNCAGPYKWRGFP